MQLKKYPAMGRVYCGADGSELLRKTELKTSGATQEPKNLGTNQQKPRQKARKGSD